MAKLFLVCISVFLSFSLHAQDKMVQGGSKIEANATIEPKEIKIGEWVQMKVDVKYPKGFELYWPELQESMPVDSIHKIDIVKQSKTDTVTVNDVVTQSRIITITAFDSGSFSIPPLVFSYREKNSDSIKQASTLPMLLSVNTIPVDTLQPIRGAKPPLDLPFTFAEIRNELILGGTLLIIIIAAVIYWIRNKKPELLVINKEPALPAHALAFKKLKEVEDKHYWQNGDVKKYYSEISDIVREYIEKRYRVLALESTTYELAVKLNNTNINRLDKMNLKELLELADLVKFAKVEPLPDEHYKALMLAREFVEHTMVPETESAEESPVTT